MKTASGLSRAQVVMVLGKVPFFRAFSLAERERLAEETASFLVATEGETIMKAGELDASFYILLSGGIEVIADQGKPAVALEPGEVIGEIGFLAQSVRTRSVVAREASILMCIDQPLMKHLRCEMREKIKDELIRRLLQRVLPEQASDHFPS